MESRQAQNGRIPPRAALGGLSVLLAVAICLQATAGIAGAAAWQEAGRPDAVIRLHAPSIVRCTQQVRRRERIVPHAASLAQANAMAAEARGARRPASGCWSVHEARLSPLMTDLPPPAA